MAVKHVYTQRERERCRKMVFSYRKSFRISNGEQKRVDFSAFYTLKHCAALQRAENNRPAASPAHTSTEGTF